MLSSFGQTFMESYEISVKTKESDEFQGCEIWPISAYQEATYILRTRRGMNSFS